ncbi:type II secretion system major pseudopilin GspG [Inhella sp.]|uniref:type II secretion system major pseudopilin GspG n=1 Tax=Inhella sp. TaxID=1921806 RepID=UPI0035B35094
MPTSIQRGFSLLELMVVLVIMGLLAGLVAPRLFGNLSQSKVKAASVQVQTLRSAVENLQLDLGRYPTAEEGLSLLSKAPADPALASKWRGPYLNNELPLDPWDQPYQYAIPGAGGQPFALYSFGADKKAGGEGDDKDLGILPAKP